MERVLLVDDHDLVRTGIRRLLEDTREFAVVGEAGSGEEALRVARECRPGIILMDINMPGMGGLEATRRLLRIDPRFRIIVVTVHVDGPFPARMLEAGVAGYVAKGSTLAEMMKAMRDVRGGRRYVGPDVAQQMVLGPVQTTRALIDSLSARELKVMIMISQGLSTQQIAEKLCLSPKTVSTYRARLFAKLGVSSDVALTHLALRYGLLELGEGT